jgi:hypothetical protein
MRILYTLHIAFLLHPEMQKFYRPSIKVKWM